MINFSKKPAFGLDLSDLSLKIVEINKKNGDLSLSGFLKQDIPQGIIEGGVIKKEKELVNILKKSLNKIDVGKQVICNLPEEKVFIRIIQLPKMNNSELEKAVYWEAEANIPLSINDVYLGWQIIEPIFEHIDHLDVLIAATPKTLVDNYLSFLKKSNLKPIALEPESVSVVRSMMTKDDLTPSIIVDLGTTGTNFVIFSALAIRFTSHINISGQLFNNAIVKKLKVDQATANELKIKVGLDLKKKEGEKIALALSPIIKDLIDQIKEYITFYHEHATHVHGPDGAIGQVILCGGDSLLIDLPKVLTNELGLPVKLGNSLINLQSIKKGSLNMTKRESFCYATAIGLALRNFI